MPFPFFISSFAFFRISCSGCNCRIIAPMRFDLFFQFRTLMVRRWLLFAFHGCWNLATG
jgi:hypothetical protein